MRCVWSPTYEVNIGDHVFPTAKYRLVKEHLLAEGVISETDLDISTPPTEEELLRAHTAEYLSDLTQLSITQRTQYSELPLTSEIVAASKLAAGGTLQACRLALVGGPSPIACHIGGGFHHAFADRAEGFCYINDIAVAIRTLQAEKIIDKATVIDCDLHQGNGTAHIFRDDPSVFTCSLHQENNYPQKEQSSIDVGLADYTGDDEYLADLQAVLPECLEEHAPQLVIYVAGADPYQDDRLGQLKITMHGLFERDRMVLEACNQRKIPVVTVTAGGYSQHVNDTVLIHAQTIAVAAELCKNHVRD